jgi:hypothetical protein
MRYSEQGKPRLQLFFFFSSFFFFSHLLRQLSLSLLFFFFFGFIFIFSFSPLTLYYIIFFISLSPTIHSLSFFCFYFLFFLPFSSFRLLLSLSLLPLSLPKWFRPSQFLKSNALSHTLTMQMFSPSQIYKVQRYDNM